jgi:hypothetical protein
MRRCSQLSGSWGLRSNTKPKGDRSVHHLVCRLSCSLDVCCVSCRGGLGGEMIVGLLAGIAFAVGAYIVLVSAP